MRREQLAQRRPGGVSLESLFSEMQEGAVQDLNIVIKADVDGSVEAAVAELQKIQHPEVRVNVIHTGVGGISENDVMLATASNAMIVGFNVRPNAEARALAEREGVEIRTYNVIYRLTEDIEQALVGMLKPVTTEETLGEAEVRALFRVSRLGTIAGSYVTTGIVRRNAKVRVVRDGTVIYDTTISQLKRFKDDVREVEEGFECGILLDGFNDVKEGDVLEVTRSSRSSAPSGLVAPTAATSPSDSGACQAASRLRWPKRESRTGRRLGLDENGMGAGYVGILSVELHFPEAGSLKGKRKHVKSAKAQLQNRFGASVAEVDHHDLWQRARLTVACVAREHNEAEQLLEEAVRYLNGQEYELVSVEKEVVTTDD